MKKIALISILVLMLLACSVSDVTNILSPLFTPTPAPLATSTVYLTPSDTPTITATLPTPTFTLTPTLIGGGFTATSSLTESPTAAFISTVSVGTPPLTPQYTGFSMVQVSGNIIRWGGCEPSSLTFTARVLNPVKVTSVTLWIRLNSPSTGESTKWETGAIMNGDSTGTYTYILGLKNISHYDEYPNAWLQYQITTNLKDVRTEPYLNSIMISKC